MSFLTQRSVVNTRTVVQRTATRGAYIASRYPHAIDRTVYARSLGYKGAASVLVFDGLVVTHGYQDWLLFCNTLRDRQSKGSKYASAA